MDIYFNKGTIKEEVVTEEEILSMTKQEIKNLKQRCQSSMNEIALKRNKFRTENELDKGSQEFWRRMYCFKGAIAKYTKALAWLGKIELDAKPPKEKEDKEHWLWCYYQESMKVLTDDMVNQIKELADTRARFHIEFEKWEYEE
jgi:hypothetical protein